MIPSSGIQPRFSDTDRRLLLASAAEAVRGELLDRAPAWPEPDEVPSRLAAAGASFVTLRRGARLLGCIGTLVPHRPLVVDVARNAWASAFADPRLPRVTHHDFRAMSIHVAVVGPLETFAAADPADLASQLEPSVDGLLIEGSGRRATFLPAVWEQVAGPEQFVALLWRKAGLEPGAWPEGMTVHRYRTIEFGDDGPRPLAPEPAARVDVRRR